LAKNQKYLFFIIPAQAGISSFQYLLDSGLRGNDGVLTFYGFIRTWLQFKKMPGAGYGYPRH
jgi:hypothetical protein